VSRLVCRPILLLLSKCVSAVTPKRFDFAHLAQSVLEDRRNEEEKEVWSGRGRATTTESDAMTTMTLSPRHPTSSTCPILRQSQSQPRGPSKNKTWLLTKSPNGCSGGCGGGGCGGGGGGKGTGGKEGERGEEGVGETRREERRNEARTRSMIDQIQTTNNFTTSLDDCNKQSSLPKKRSGRHAR